MPTTNKGVVGEERFMLHAIELARAASGWTNPNPLVGAVIERDGRILGEGCHEHFGQLHAERNALKQCAERGEDPAGATMYVTLEPCNHTGHQPPCTEAIVEAGIARVFVGSRDPNPLVAGAGVRRLREAGIEVIEDFCRDRCDTLNPIFFHYITTGRPFILAKWAMSADGKIATRTGDARWVSNEASRADTHELRQRCAAIMVGVNTVLADDPLLTCRRDMPSKNPVRVICDSHLRTPLSCKLLASLDEAPVLIATCEAQGPRADALRAAGAELICAPGANGEVDLVELIDELGRREIDSVLLEGGSTLHAAAFEAGIVDEVCVYLAPKIVGGTMAKSPVGGLGIERMADVPEYQLVDVTRLGDDVRLTYRREEVR